jgi:hypothetical protein
MPAAVRRRAARFVAARRAADVERQLESIAADRRPILVGPWLGEVGFELLYWVPFLRWFAGRYDVHPDRLIALSRGGASVWYRDVAASAYDALGFVAPDEFRRRNEERARTLGEQKQIRPAPFDQDLVGHVRAAVGRDLAVLHPSLMYRLFHPYWWGHAPLSFVRRYTAFTPLPRPARALDLPERYTAVKFYFNDCFSSTDAHREFVRRQVADLAARGPVVSLSTGFAVDEHAEPDIGAPYDIRHLMTPQTNLAVQDEVVARASGFVGTYGGFAYLAPLHGIPAVTYFTDASAYSARHLDLMLDVVRSQGRPELLQVLAAQGVAA